MSVSINTKSSSWLVGSSQIYVPATPCKVEHSNVVSSDSGRDESGTMQITWLRTDVRKVYLTYKAISASELAYMMGLMQGKEFSFTFPDQGSSTTISACYCGESSYEYYTNTLGDEPVYINFSINVIEK